MSVKMTTTMNLTSSLKPAFKSAVLLLGAVSLLAGCASKAPTIARYQGLPKVTVAENVERLELYVRPQGFELSGRDEAAMMNFINGYRRAGNGGFYLNVPSNVAGAPSMRAALANVQNVLMRSGMSAVEVKTGQYQVAPRAVAPLVLSYRHLSVRPMDCHLNTSLANTDNNGVWENFGCAHQANFAAMIGDPRQLVDPYPAAAPSAARRTEVFDKYILGEDTSSAMPERQQVSADSEE